MATVWVKATATPKMLKRLVARISWGTVWIWSRTDVYKRQAYAQAFARYIQCEEAISTYGLLGKHPTTGGAIASPFVSMSQSFQKQANLIWYEDVYKRQVRKSEINVSDL